MGTTNDPVRAAIVATLSTAAPDLGRAHPYQRYSKTSADLLKLYGWTDPATGSTVLRGWFVSLVAERYSQIRVGRRVVTTDWRLVGLMGFDDAAASELLIAALARTVVDAFRADPTLGGTVNRQSDGGDFDAPAGCQIVSIEPVMFAGVLAHRATLALTTQHFQQEG